MGVMRDKTGQIWAGDLWEITGELSSNIITANMGVMRDKTGKITGERYHLNW